MKLISEVTVRNRTFSLVLVDGAVVPAHYTKWNASAYNEKDVIHAFNQDFGILEDWASVDEYYPPLRPSKSRFYIVIDGPVGPRENLLGGISL